MWFQNSRSVRSAQEGHSSFSNALRCPGLWGHEPPGWCWRDVSMRPWCGLPVAINGTVKQPSTAASAEPEDTFTGWGLGHVFGSVEVLKIPTSSRAAGFVGLQMTVRRHAFFLDCANSSLWMHAAVYQLDSCRRHSQDLCQPLLCGGSLWGLLQAFF